MGNVRFLLFITLCMFSINTFGQDGLILEDRPDLEVMSDGARGIGNARFGPDRLMWEDRVDFGGALDNARAITVSGNTAVVAGLGSVAGGLDLVVRAYDTATGTVLWADQTAAFSGLATRVFITSADGFAYVAGYTAGADPGSRDIFVRAYNVATGDVLWEDVFDKGFDDTPQGIVANSNAVVVAGYGGNIGSDPIDFLVRAYDPSTGSILWEDQINKRNAEDAAWAVAIDGGQVFVAGTTRIGPRRDLILRSYDARCGFLRWERQRFGILPTAIAVASGRLFVAGVTGFSSRAYLAAFETGSGSLLWQDTSTTGTFQDVAVRGKQVVAAGSAGRGLLVRAYNVRNGAVLWQDLTTPAPGYGEFISAIDITDNAVYAAGQDGQDFEYSEFLVRAYDLNRGKLAFTDRTQRSDYSSATDIAIGGRRAFAVGVVTNADGSFNTDWLVRSYRVSDVEGFRRSDD